MLVCRQSESKSFETELRAPLPDETVWIHLENSEAGEVEYVLKDLYHCHPLVVEDCIKLNQRPKLDRYTDHIFLTFFPIIDKKLTVAELGIIIGANHVITVCKKPIPLIGKLKDHFLQIEGSMKNPGAVLHQLLDRCVDDYTEIINQVEDRVDRMERHIYKNPYLNIAREIFQLKRTFHQLRRIIVEEKTIIGSIRHQTFPYVRKEADVYIIDIYDHISRVVDSLDVFRESLTGLLELQMSMKSDRMNQIMKTLTILSSIFLPLTFIVGLYGMNFKEIPKLSWDFGYGYVWALMIAVIVGMWIIFKWKRWI
ncbi:magnesium/cobalt transporter CorA [Paenibacillus filicis]|uniref:Magnesium transport protein CorA n=1 Tax=Paenibacillus gyeongsangnamensis TaxID=3388067 RepID=A0ABT4Q6S9_9BACL|nr:magnesium/cobalt transporter CorA [Paenibacillus filicis]MCZ8512576.1 magnesium/cobalt transporter CorA [Paenibacillus filicis]